MKLFILLLATTITSAFELTTFPDTISYNEKRQSIQLQKEALAKSYSTGTITIDSVSTRFQELLINELIPYWYGTPWEFYGHTDSPDSGEIACGYFVSTTLKHLGVNLNRYRMAQQSALSEIKTVAGTSAVRKYSRSDSLVEQLKAELNNGLYILGLDCHVGYLFKSETTIYFIHSNYLSPYMVVIEDIEDSPAFANSDLYYIGEVSGQKQFLEKWLRGTKVKVVMD